MNELIKGAIARFAAKHGRKLWKTELRKCWSRSSYPGMGSDDSSYLQMARNSGVDLDKLTYDELTTPPAPATDNQTATPATITQVIRDIKDGDCMLSAIFEDGKTRLLFSYYIDELSFSDGDLVGLTEDEAHKLRQQRDVAHLRS